MTPKNYLTDALLKASLALCILASATAIQAEPFDLSLPDNIELIEISSTEEAEITKLDLEFRDYKPLKNLKEFKDNIFTLYQNKNEKIKATYLQGAYALSYTLTGK